MNNEIRLIINIESFYDFYHQAEDPLLFRAYCNIQLFNL